MLMSPDGGYNVADPASMFATVPVWGGAAGIKCKIVFTCSAVKVAGKLIVDHQDKFLIVIPLSLQP